MSRSRHALGSRVACRRRSRSLIAVRRSSPFVARNDSRSSSPRRNASSRRSAGAISRMQLASRARRADPTDFIPASVAQPVLASPRRADPPRTLAGVRPSHAAGSRYGTASRSSGNRLEFQTRMSLSEDRATNWSLRLPFLSPAADFVVRRGSPRLLPISSDAVDFVTRQRFLRQIQPPLGPLSAGCRQTGRTDRNLQKRSRRPRHPTKASPLRALPTTIALRGHRQI